MDKETLSALRLPQLRQLAKNHSISLPTGLRKHEIIDLLAQSLPGHADTETAEPIAPPPVAGVNPAVPELIKSGGCGKARGVLEIQRDGYGFLRALDEGQKDV